MTAHCLFSLSHIWISFHNISDPLIFPKQKKFLSGSALELQSVRGIYRTGAGRIYEKVLPALCDRMGCDPLLPEFFERELLQGGVSFEESCCVHGECGTNVMFWKFGYAV